MPKLYTHPMSTFAQRVRIALAEKGVDWELEQVDMVNRKQREEPYLSINPYGRVPSLVDEEHDLTLIESSAILEYLEELHPEPALFPADPARRAEARMHVKLCDLQFTGPVGVLIFPKRFIPEERWRRDDMAAASAKIAKHFAILAKQLEGREWLVGDAFSVADLAYAPFLQFTPMLDVEVPASIEAWTKRLLARPSVMSTRPADASR